MFLSLSASFINNNPIQSFPIQDQRNIETSSVISRTTLTMGALHHLSRTCLSILLYLHGGDCLIPADKPLLSRRDALVKMPFLAATAGGSLLLFTMPMGANAAAEEGGQGDLRDSLRPASEDQPQIPLPTSQDPNSVTTVVEGLLSLKNPRSELRPAATDTILLTVTDLKQPDLGILAGAKLPVSRIRFPLRFRLSTSNLLADKAVEWKDSAADHDLVVQAVVCPEDGLSNTKARGAAASCSNARMQAKGVAKLLRLQDQGVTIRAAVALALE